MFSTYAFSQKKLTPSQLLKRYKYAMVTAFKVNNFNLALDYAKRADSLQHNQPETKYISGIAYLYSNTKMESLKPLLFAKSRNYKPKEIDFYLGQAYHYNNKFDSAIFLFKNQLRKIDTGFSASDQNQVMYKELKAKIKQCEYGKQMVHDSLNVEIKNLGPLVNTKYSEYVPVVNADETIMYFTSRRSSTTNGKQDIDNKYFEDVYVSNFENGEWKEPKNIGSPINGNDHDACIGISPDGQKLFVYRSKSASATSGNILMSSLDGLIWNKPKKLGSNINSRKGWESSACLTPDGKRLYFSSDRPGGKGGLDIYFAELNSEGEWAEPINAGSPINTPDNEDAPFMHFDGKTLFFSSDGHKTIGGYDIFTSTYLPDSSKWSFPQNLGYPVNTSDDDSYFVYSADGSKGYFSAHRKDSYGERDLYVVKRHTSDPNMIVMAGRILNKETSEPIYSTITVTNLESHKVIGVYNSNKLSGKYVLALNFDVNHSIEIESEGYVFNSENVNVSKNVFKLQHNQDFYLEKAKAGAKITLNNIFFEFDKSVLKPESMVELDNVYELLSTNPNWQTEISGHTDSIDSQEYNMKLSKSRALEVVNYLIDKGIDPKAVIPVGYGKTKPIATNVTEEGRAQNRRTEFTIKSTDRIVVIKPKADSLIKNSKLSLDDVLEKADPADTSSTYKLKMKVHFMVEDGSILTDYSKKQLDRIISVLNNNIHFKLKLVPLIDVVRNEYNNKKLYEQRARTVMEYLSEKGITKSRLLKQDFKATTSAKILEIGKSDINNRGVEFWVSK